MKKDEHVVPYIGNDSVKTQSSKMVYSGKENSNSRVESGCRAMGMSHSLQVSIAILLCVVHLLVPDSLIAQKLPPKKNGGSSRETSSPVNLPFISFTHEIHMVEYSIVHP
jgi:hypothetical protein